MPNVTTAALIVSIIATTVATFAAVQSWLARRAAQRSSSAAETSAREAVEAGRRARRPQIHLRTRGWVDGGFLRFSVEVDSDLDELRMEIDHELHGSGSGAFRHIYGEQGFLVGSVVDGDALVLRSVHQGLPIDLKSPLETSRPPDMLRLSLRCRCTSGPDEWVVTPTAGPMPLHWVL